MSIELRLMGRLDNGEPTGVMGTVFCANGQQAEEGLQKFHGKIPGLLETGHTLEEARERVREDNLIAAGSVVRAK